MKRCATGLSVLFFNVTIPTGRLCPSDLVAELAEFSEIFHLTPELARQRNFADQQKIQEPRCWDHLIAAVI